MKGMQPKPAVNNLFDLRDHQLATAGLKHISHSLNPKVVWAALSRTSQQCNSSSMTIA